jgi:hypothetical protein
MAVPNIFGTATSAIPLSQLDTNFATPVTIGNTAVQLGNTVTSFGNVTLTNVTISSGNVTITGANVSGTANVSTLVVTGNQSFVGTGNRITGDFSNATASNRVIFQTSTASANTRIGIMPNAASSGTAGPVLYATNDPNNASTFDIRITDGVSASLQSAFAGTGTYLPMTFVTGGTESLRLSATTKAVILAGGSTSADGTGITFPAAVNASSDVNTLDDYEEGTWTPVITPSSGSFGSYTASGQFTKIGNIVSLNFNIVISAVGTVPTTASLTITSLPFSGTTNTGAGVCREIAINGFTGSTYFQGSTSLLLQNYNSTGAVPANNTNWTCAITYRAV